MAATSTVYGGSIAITRSGYVVPCISPVSSTDVVWGIVSKQTDNSATSYWGGATGAVNCPIDRGAFWIAYSGSVTQADVGATVYAYDEQTVTKTASTRPVAGIILAVDTAISKVAVNLKSSAGA
jgi:hypothetical protein